jgi:Archaeal/vacuolar-type H+-ATPase subunit B
MKGGIGTGRTREDHADVNNQLYASYAQGIKVKNLVAVVGEESLTDTDRNYLEFADRFEHEFVRQKTDEDRSFEQTLDLAWNLLSIFPESELKRIDREYIQKYHPVHRGGHHE